MTDLIERLSAATEGSRDLSDEVLLACGWKRPHDHLWKTPDKEWCRSNDRPTPTVSLDDALALVPEDGVWRAETDWGGLFRASVSLIDGPFAKGTESDAATVPLAMCMAILKAINPLKSPSTETEHE